MIYCVVVILASAVIIFVLRQIAIKRGMPKGQSLFRQRKPGTYWVSAVFWAVVFTLMFGDSIIVHNINLAPWGEAAIFFAVFFISIFLDQRTRFRGIMALAASFNLGVFYIVYSTAP